ncbi:OLC1v1010920C1 [Oldenlandia corymbosa var. corymbosa]|uniref:OLC1v1010920C1 n=1 Tax=Oldenlandia corymbosa var. corymbosa TaxID=529605 RepID=A0AAV1DSI2_OLDCO|nr:OLC1v1010920C1 [Oldenlandia corymbosa var. corymbosa]
MMQSFAELQSTATSLFTAYASMAATMMLMRSMVNDIIPQSVKDYLYSFLSYLFTPKSNQTTIVIDEQTGMIRNQVYESAEIYLSTKISPSTDRFKVNKTPKQKSINITIEKDEPITDTFAAAGGGDKIQLTWRFVSLDPRNDNQVYTPERRYFELSFNKKYRDTVMDEYLPFVLQRAKEIRDSDKVVKLYTRDCPYSDDDYNGGGGNGVWGSINLDHPATFDTLAMEPEMKKAIIDDLERFVKRRDYYRRVGRAWKRGYLLYGPPGTGKSSLIAAMANHLKFDIYDLELTSLFSNSELRRIMISTTNRSIIVIEDIDCSVEMHDRQLDHGFTPPSHEGSNAKLTLSGLLNFIDGLWSSVGDERIIIFTTNHKDKLDPALLRPGRMDMHIHMSYCTVHGLRKLVSNYLDIDRDYNPGVFDEIESLIDGCEVTPAEVAEELMRSEDADLAMEGVLNMLKKKMANNNKSVAEVKDDDAPSPSTPEDENEATEELGKVPDFQESKRMKTDFAMRRGLRRRRGGLRGGSRFLGASYR